MNLVMDINGKKQLDLPLLQQQFPVLDRPIRNKRLVYLDNAATTLKPLRVINAVDRYYRFGTANIHRGVHLLSEEATGLYEEVRGLAQKFINAADEREIIFTTGTTGGINLVARSFVKPRLSPGDEILITTLEHHANIVPWQMICEETGAKLVVAPIDDSGALILEEFTKRISKRTKFISATWVSNALGVINPVPAMIAAAKANHVPILIDAAQTVAHAPVDVQALDVDFLVFSGHKLYGPTGVGILYGKYSHLESMQPMIGGGDMIKTVTFEKTEYAEPPARFEAGTPAISQVIGLGEAIRFVSEDLDFGAIWNHEQLLLKKCREALSEMPGIRIYGDTEHKVPIFSMTVEGIHPHDVGSILDQHGVAVRTGHHCTQPLLARLGISATVRASFSIYNTEADIEALVSGLWRTRELFA